MIGYDLHPNQGSANPKPTREDWKTERKQCRITSSETESEEQEGQENNESLRLNGLVVDAFAEVDHDEVDKARVNRQRCEDVHRNKSKPK